LLSGRFRILQLWSPRRLLLGPANVISRIFTIFRRLFLLGKRNGGICLRRSLGRWFCRSLRCWFLGRGLCWSDVFCWLFIIGHFPWLLFWSISSGRRSLGRWFCRSLRSWFLGRRLCWSDVFCWLFIIGHFPWLLFWSISSGRRSLGRWFCRSLRCWFLGRRLCWSDVFCWLFIIGHFPWLLFWSISSGRRSLGRWFCRSLRCWFLGRRLCWSDVFCWLFIIGHFPWLLFWSISSGRRSLGRWFCRSLRCWFLGRRLCWSDVFCWLFIIGHFPWPLFWSICSGRRSLYRWFRRSLHCWLRRSLRCWFLGRRLCWSDVFCWLFVIGHFPWLLLWSISSGRRSLCRWFRRSLHCWLRRSLRCWFLGRRLCWSDVFCWLFIIGHFPWLLLWSISSGRRSLCRWFRRSLHCWLRRSLRCWFLGRRLCWSDVFCWLFVIGHFPWLLLWSISSGRRSLCRCWFLGRRLCWSDVFCWLFIIGHFPWLLFWSIGSGRRSLGRWFCRSLRCWFLGGRLCWSDVFCWLFIVRYLYYFRHKNYYLPRFLCRCLRPSRRGLCRGRFGRYGLRWFVLLCSSTNRFCSRLRWFIFLCSNGSGLGCRFFRLRLLYRRLGQSDFLCWFLIIRYLQSYHCLQSEFSISYYRFHISSTIMLETRLHCLRPCRRGLCRGRFGSGRQRLRWFVLLCSSNRFGSRLRWFIFLCSNGSGLGCRFCRLRLLYRRLGQSDFLCWFLIIIYLQRFLCRCLRPCRRGLCRGRFGSGRHGLRWFIFLCSNGSGLGCRFCRVSFLYGRLEQSDFLCWLLII
ncbi:hypothetical protein PFISCL1PPCAC_24421, partial [Pristionchus fissidentatus]